MSLTPTDMAARRELVEEVDSVRERLAVHEAAEQGVIDIEKVSPEIRSMARLMWKFAEERVSNVTNKVIAERLCTSPSTVSRMRRDLMDSLLFLIAAETQVVSADARYIEPAAVEPYFRLAQMYLEEQTSVFQLRWGAKSK